MRLALGLTTFFQHTSDYVLLFDKSGVYHLASNLPWDAIQDLPTDHIAWALVDSLPGFFLSYHHHFSSWRHALLVETDGVG